MASLTLWAGSGRPPPGTGPCALWNDYLPADASQEWHSLPDEVISEGAGLRARYLSWVHDVGRRVVDGRTVLDLTSLRPGLNYWWMTLPAEFSLAPGSPVYTAVRLLALDDLVRRLSATSITVVTDDELLAGILRDWCATSGLAFHRRSSQRDGRPPSHTRRKRRALYRRVPPLAALRVFASHAAIAMMPKPKRQESQPEDGILFFDYLAHFGPGVADGTAFDSRFWGPLVEQVNGLIDPVTWVHLPAELASPKVVRASRKLVEQFNAAPMQKRHDLLHDHLTWKVLARSVRDYARLARVGGIVRTAVTQSPEPARVSSPGAAFSAVVNDHYFGKSAMLNSILINLFEESLTRQPHSRLGVYLFENQPWEMALQYAWRVGGHGRLIGAGHSSMHFWDTRLFKDPRDEWATERPGAMPWPDAVAVNGPLMRVTAEASGYPAHRLIDVEALRYLDLHPAAPRYTDEAATRLLVLGDITPAATQHLIDLAVESFHSLDAEVELVLRPHPAVGRGSFHLSPPFTLDLHDSIHAALEAADVVLVSDSSTTSLEVAVAGRPLLVALNSRTLGSGPCEGIEGAEMIRSSADVTRALARRTVSSTERRTPAATIFCQEATLDRWMSLLRAPL